jgi:hypothetical protein
VQLGCFSSHIFYPKNILVSFVRVLVVVVKDGVAINSYDPQMIQHVLCHPTPMEHDARSLAQRISEGLETYNK